MNLREGEVLRAEQSAHQVTEFYHGDLIRGTGCG